MKKLSIFLLILGFSLLLPINNASADFWARGVSESSGWFDAEKDSVNTEDELLCWSASAANILSWSGWDYGYADEDAIFDWLELEDPVDAGGWQSYAWNFWFDGSELDGHFTGSSHTGYYTTAEYNAAYDYEWDNADLDVALDIAADWLQNDYGVGIAVITDSGSMYHAVTLWGIDTDDSGDYLGVWITDSDNDKYGPDPRPDSLNYYTVSFTNNLWYLDGWNAAIVEMDALQFVPVPAAVLLGILGLGVAGLKLRKYA